MKQHLVLALLPLLGACHKQEKIETAAPRPAALTPPDKLNFRTPRSSYADAVERVEPGVVTIRAARRAQIPTGHPTLADPHAGDFSGQTFGSSPSQSTLQIALGSGVIVRPDGTILTNYHVITAAEAITVELADQRMVDATVVGSDPPSDLALLKIEAKNLAAVKLGDSDRVRVGDIALAIGNPLGVGQTVTAGIISAKGRSTGLGNGSYEDFLQTDASINQGNSGGALINIDGELIGINSQILSNSGASIGIGFAIPSNMARNVMEQLIKSGRVRRSRLGVAIQPMSRNQAASIGLSDQHGMIINNVAPNSPAAQAGMRAGDVILAFNDTPVTDSNSLRNYVANRVPGSEVKFTIFRDLRAQNIKVILGEYEAKSPAG